MSSRTLRVTLTSMMKRPVAAAWPITLATHAHVTRIGA
jgi:hypothetical protein